MDGREEETDRVESGPRVVYRDEKGEYHHSLGSVPLSELVEGGTGPLWVDLDSRDDDQYRLLTDLFRFHPLAVEDVRSPRCRVKVEEYRDCLFLVVRGIRFATEAPEPYGLDTANLYLFLTPRILVTAHAGGSTPVEEVRSRLASAPEILDRGVDRLAYRIVDILVDHYFPLLDQIDEFVDEVEARIFDGTGSSVFEGILELKRALLTLRRHLAPMREVAATLSNRPSPYLEQGTQIYLRDVYDHLVRQVESVEGYRELVSGALEMNLMIISNRVNEVMKVLSVIATVVLPPTLVASIYGMNFDRLPGTGSPHGFWLALLGMLLISLGFLGYLWRKRWL